MATTTHGGRRAGAGRRTLERRPVRRLIYLSADADGLLTDLMDAYGLSRSQVIVRLLMLPLANKLEAFETSAGQ